MGLLFEGITNNVRAFTVSRTNRTEDVATSNASLHFTASITFGAHVAYTSHAINNTGETLEKNNHTCSTLGNLL